MPEGESVFLRSGFASRSIRSILAALFASLGLVSCTPREITVCQLVAESDRLSGRTVSVRGIYQTDHQHFSHFTDESCPDLALEWRQADTSRTTAVGEAFLAALAAIRNARPTLDPMDDVRVDVIAKFWWRNSTNHPRGLVVVKQIRSFEVVDHVFVDELERQRHRCYMRATTGMELDAASEACDAAVRLSNGAGSDLSTRGRLRLRQGRYGAAWEDYNAALRRAPNNADALFGRGIAAVRLGRLEDGRTDIERAIRTSPAIASIYANMGFTAGDELETLDHAP